jgi:hypothetical protein
MPSSSFHSPELVSISIPKPIHPAGKQSLSHSKVGKACMIYTPARQYLVFKRRHFLDGPPTQQKHHQEAHYQAELLVGYQEKPAGQEGISFTREL